MLSNIHASTPSFVKSDFSFVKRKSNVYLFEYPCESEISCSLLSVTFDPGLYLIECWGGSGGNRSDDVNDGGKGAYVSGKISFFERKTLYLSIGSKGGKNYEGVFGGGGKSISYIFTRTGGGATDIRISNDLGFNGLKDRIMVAGAGGGAVVHGAPQPGGYGGNEIGGVGSITYNPDCTNFASLKLQQPANQTHGGTSTNQMFLATKATDGKFGYGGDLLEYYSGTGGGGYYGGGTGAAASCVVSTGAGGSSFVSGHEKCDAIYENSTEDGIYHTGKGIHYSGLTFVSPEMKSGNEYIPIPGLFTTGTQKGHTGNGFVRITIIYSRVIIKTCSIIPRDLFISTLLLITIKNI